MHRISCASIAFLAASLLATPARADDVAEPSAAPPESAADATVQAHLDAALGASSMGPYAGVLGLVRLDWFELGGVGEATGALGTKVGGGVLAGVGGHRGSSSFGWDALVEAGSHRHHVSAGILSDDPGVSSVVPYLGARVGIHWRVTGPTKHVRFVHGLWLFGSRDLTESTRTVRYLETGWFSGQPSQREATHTMGGQILFGLAYAIGFDGS